MPRKPKYKKLSYQDSIKYLGISKKEFDFISSMSMHIYRYNSMFRVVDLDKIAEIYNLQVNKNVLNNE